MNGRKAKLLRKIARNTAQESFGKDVPEKKAMSMTGPGSSGGAQLAPDCVRGTYQRLKRDVKKGRLVI